jgi:acyl-CoA dehydrogenase
MDFSFTSEQESFKKSLKEFCERKLAPKAREIDEKGEIPQGILDDMASFGLLGIIVSNEYGGSGVDFVTAAIAAGEIARADISMALPVYYLVVAGWGFLIERYGSKRAKEEVLPDVARGKKFLGIASTETGGGSDIANISTVMEKKDEKLIIKGTKTFISGVREAVKSGGGYVTLVKTDPELGHRGLSLLPPDEGDAGNNNRDLQADGQGWDINRFHNHKQCRDTGLLPHRDMEQGVLLCHGGF